MKTALAALLLTASPALATIDVIFDEGAPKDRFTFTNSSRCALGPATLTLDLSESSGGLIFDTTGSGAGVEVFQPFEAVAGGDVIGKVSAVTDGDTQIELTLSGLSPDQSVAFTIDVDDTLRQSALGQKRVTDSEIAGASVRIATGGGSTIGVFDDTSRVVLQTASCSG